MSPTEFRLWDFSRRNQLLRELGFDIADSQASDFEETIVELGAQIVVVGTLEKRVAKTGEVQSYRDAPAELRIVGDKARPLAISTTLPR